MGSLQAGDLQSSAATAPGVRRAIASIVVGAVAASSRDSYRVMAAWTATLKCCRILSMPEVRLSLEWPDGHRSELYSPSTVILDFLQPGQTLSVAELTSKGMTALEQASERVRARYGFACTRTDEERVRLQQAADSYAADQLVRIAAG